MRRRRAALLALLFVVALAARVVVFVGGSDRPTNDELAYRQLATEIAMGHGFSRDGEPETHIAPLFPLLHALPIALGMDPHSAGRTVGLLAAALGAPLVAWALVPLLPGRWPWVAGLLVAVHPRLLVTAERMQPEALAAALLLLVCGWWLRDRPWGVALAAALAYLTRPEAVVLLPLVLLLAVAQERHSARRWLLPTAAALLIASPYLLHLKAATGGWAVSGKTSWVYAMAVVESQHGNEPVEIDKLRAVEEQVRSPWSHLRRDPAAATAGYIQRLLRTLTYLTNAVFWPLLGLALAGVVYSARQGSRVSGFLIPLSLLLVIPVGVVHARHVLPYVPLILGATVVGVWSIIELTTGQRRMSA